MKSYMLLLVAAAAAMSSCAVEPTPPPPPPPPAAAPVAPAPPAAPAGTLTISGTVGDTVGGCRTITADNGTRYAVHRGILPDTPAGARVRVVGVVSQRQDCPGATLLRVQRVG
jgi:hypothetical protein